MIEYIITGASIIATCASCVFSFLKTKKEFNANGMIVLFSKIPFLVQEAEKMFPARGSGANKLNYVLTNLRVYALENKLKYSEDILVESIESIVTTTKNVNIHTPINAECDNSPTDTNIVENNITPIVEEVTTC